MANETKPPAASHAYVKYVVIAGVAVLMALWLGSGFYTIAPNETGVVMRFGRMPELNGTVGSGIHYALPWPIEQVFKVGTGDIRRIEVGYMFKGAKSSEPRRSDMLTGDANILKIRMAVQYKIKNAESFLFGTDEPEWLVERVVESAMSQCIASKQVDDVLTTEKEDIQLQTMRMAQLLLDQYGAGIQLQSGNLQDVDPPMPVIDAFKEVASAKKDGERMDADAHAYEDRRLAQARGEATRRVKAAEAYYERRINEASGETSRFLSLLEEYEKSRNVTRARLYVDAMERILSNAKLVVLGDDGKTSASHLTIVEQH